MQHKPIKLSKTFIIIYSYEIHVVKLFYLLLYKINKYERLYICLYLNLNYIRKHINSWETYPTISLISLKSITNKLYCVGII